MMIFLSPRRVSPFLAWGDSQARSRFARSTIPEEKWRTTRSLTKLWTPEIFMEFYCVVKHRPETSRVPHPNPQSSLTPKKHLNSDWVRGVSLA